MEKELEAIKEWIKTSHNRNDQKRFFYIYDFADSRGLGPIEYTQEEFKKLGGPHEEAFWIFCNHSIDWARWDSYWGERKYEGAPCELLIELPQKIYEQGEGGAVLAEDVVEFLFEVLKYMLRPPAITKELEDFL